ncbi:MAG: O-succinylbenzoate synthase [uncultured Rubrobacteraceae bacterium]|uniref:o-succinylbenzoate synthase n=1 Tax=uncultured Rubrobacteraceae bacterium TaxID=349277 RepID=A0A6J4PJI2_9ACTN|nr:MAG: O-succinylbenzoate synthase [uncultured Rubrobacteraceae bacterium]
MRIEGFDLYRYELALSEPVTLKGTTLHRREGSLIRLTAEDGHEGWGEAAPLPYFSPESLEDTIEHLRATAPELVGRRMPEDIQKSDNGPVLELASLSPSARFGLEVALLNLHAACRGEALPDLRSDDPTKTIYTNGLISGSLEKMLVEAFSMGEAGYRAVKLKVGRRKVYEDMEVVRRVGEILGGGVSLRLDANRAWGFEEALEFAGGISGTRIEYVEEPLAAPARLGELAREWGLPVALDESLVGMLPEDLGRHAYARAVVLKPTLLGGVSRVLGFAERAKALGMAAVVSSSYEGGVGMGALVALAASVGEEPAGLDTYRALAEDVIEAPLPLPAPTVDVREAMEAARTVDVNRLQPLSLR